MSLAPHHAAPAPHALRAALALASAALLALSCARRQSEPSVTPEGPWTGKVELTVENHHWLDVTISVIRDGQTSRIGLVTAATSRDLAFAPHLLGQGGLIQLEAHAIGSGSDPRTGVKATLLSETIRVAPGQAIVWSLERDLRRSTIAVY